MSRFIKISLEVLATDVGFAEYLRQSNIKSAKKGGTFVGNYEVALDEFSKYGIILPKGGMIIPDMEPDELREIVSEPERRREVNDIANRRIDEEAYLDQVRDVLTKSGISDILLLAEDGREYHNIGSTSWHKTFFVRGEEKIFNLHSEEEPYRCLNDDSFKPWRVNYAPLDEVEIFLKEEAHLVEPRRLFADRINRLIEMSHAVGQQVLGEDGWDRPRVEVLLYDDYSKITDWGFFGRRCKSVLSVHRIMYRKKLYELTDEDITHIESEVGSRAVKAKERQDTLKRLFFESKGVFSLTNEEKSCFAGRSLVTGKAKHDEWNEPHYFLEQKEVTQEEYEWLNSFLGEIPVPTGYVRVANDTNDLFCIPEMPGQNDVLVVEGKTGSRRGEWSYGEWFRGHPSKCQISFWHKGTMFKIRRVTLNGQVQESKYVNLDLWKEPYELARRALRETGMENPENEYVKAVTEVYRRQLDK